MTIFAGLFCRHAGARVGDSTCDALRRSLSRDTRDAVSEFRDARVFLAKVDIGVYSEPAFLVRPGGSVSLLAGEPLLPTGDSHLARSRSADLALLHDSWDRSDWSPLAGARGVFCAVHYHPDASRLTLITDKLGVRPLYYWIGDDHVIFATALRVLEGLADLPKQMDLRAVTEAACFGFPLGDRTPYQGVRALRAAEIVEVSGAGVGRSQYWRWDDIPPASRPQQELLQEAYDRFTAAVACRQHGDRTTTAFLSGGLDSRCVVAALRAQSAEAHTFNFALPGTQDRILGARFANAVGARHHQATLRAHIELRFSALLAEALSTPEHKLTPPPERPRVVWSGDGGSVGVGHVYLTRAMVDQLRAGHRDDAIAAFLDRQKASVLRKLLRPEIAAALADVPRRGIREELDDLRCADPGRSLHLFLLLNDQRRHLAGHFEDIDLHRLEFTLPFFDSDFQQTMLSVPIDLCLYHEFYVKWLGLFPAAVTSVPWQSYPGHVPCPLPIPPGLHYQWQAAPVRAWHGPRKRALLRRAAEMLEAQSFPRDLLSKPVLRVAGWIYRTGLRDYGYVIRHASLYYTYWERSAGRWVVPGAASAPPPPPSPDATTGRHRDALAR
ncbi:MAG: hypothetical protein AUI57_12275 [Candidatus Rokubacteria bacterium 13_1_40CM_2_68_8]|nr:MAG: hypothetical protein AUH42_01040 [Gemmatimonadetes bacterium 13_1_40CM_70_11]OLC70120.1 MAG: hypothetical protein AUH78_21900 [Gemmatimonadetes bacterium 13_1_40CM_4_69_8]OLD37085.1 MAG: hypothetical protein AUI57_12275 [Candidatus Rokubacteria bacterium 13_1_40CM_2_68_8]